MYPIHQSIIEWQLNDFKDKPMTTIDLAFKGLFYKNHARTSEKTIEEIYLALKDKSKLIETIGKMLSECYDTLLDDGDNDQGNIQWDIVN